MIAHKAHGALLLAVALLCATLVGSHLSGSRAAVAARATDGQVSTTSTPSDYPPGVPAITPSRVAASQVEAGFTEAEVAQYLAVHPLLKPLTAAAGKVVKISFVTAAQIAVMLNHAFPRPPTALVCYVEVQGPLLPDPLSLPPGFDNSRLQAAPFGVLAFDAQTGNLLLRSFMY